MNENKEIVAILIPGFPESEEDTICLPAQQSFVLNLQRSLPDLHVIVLTFHYPYHHRPYLWNGIRVIPFSGKNKGGISGYFMRRRIDGVLRQLHQQNGIRALLSFWYEECAYVAQVFSKKTGVPHYCWIRGQDAKKENHYPHRLQLKAGQLIALSDFLQDEFERNHGVRPQWLVSQAIDAKNFENAEAKDIDLLAVGSLIPLKRLEIFIEVVQFVKEKIPGIKCVIVGKGDERERLEKMVEERGLMNCIQFTGELPYGEVIHYMQKAKVLIHPSSYEGFSGVCLEALAAGAQVISFCQPVKEKIENWHIVNGVEEMKEKALEILKSPVTPKSIIPFRIEDSVEKIKRLLLNRREHENAELTQSNS